MVITLAASALATQFTSAYTFTEDELIEYSQNDIALTKPCGNDEEDGVCGDNTNYDGQRVFTDAQLEAIEANMPFYQKAAEKYDFPWELIAVIHKREHGLQRSNPSNGQGVYQFASAARRASCKGGDFTSGKISDEQFQIQTDCVADAIKNSYGAGLDLNTDEGVKKMFFKYNGQAQAYIDQAKKLGFSDEEAANGEGSPYVMNRYDAKREPSNTWGQIKRDGGRIEYPANSDFGAFTMYKALTCDGGDDGTIDDSEGAGADSDDGEDDAADQADSTTNAQKIADTALELAGSPGSISDAQEKAAKELGTWGVYKKHSDCGKFVKLVVATAMPKGAVWNTKSANMDRFRVQLVSGKYSKYWEVIKWDGSRSKLKNGDVIWGGSDATKYKNSHQHYWIAAKKNGKLHKFEAGYSAGKWGHDAGRVPKKWTSYSQRYIFRAKGGGSASGTSCNPKVSGSKNLNAAAAAMAWPYKTDSKKYNFSTGSPRPVDDVDLSKYYSNNYLKKHAYCSGFTGAVARYAYDKNFPDAFSTSDFHSASNQKGYAEKSDLWDVIKWDGKVSEVKGGDIIVERNSKSEHSYMAVEDQDGQLWLANAHRGANQFGFIQSKFNGKCTIGSCSERYILRAKNANNSSAGVSVTGEGTVKTSSTTGDIEKSSKSDKNLGDAAVELAWPYSDFTGKKKYTKKATDTFKKFYETLSGRDGDSNGKGGKSCDYFAHTAVVYAGLDSNDKFPWILTKIRDYVVAGNGWQEVEMKDNRKLDEYQHGDLVLYFCNDGNSKCDKPFTPGVQHVAILVEVDGKKYTAQASHATYYGVIKGTGNITGDLGPGDANFDYIRVFRHSDNSSSTSGSGEDACDPCSDNGDLAATGQLTDGGFKTVAEARKAVIEEYKALWDNESAAVKKYHLDGADACNGRHIDNCTAFSRWFINRFAKGKMWTGATGNGRDVAGNVAMFYGLAKTKVPSVYSVFSGESGSAWGHTGIVLGIDKKRGKIIYGEAGWCKGKDFIDAKEGSLAHFQSQYTFVNLNSILKGL